MLTLIILILVILCSASGKSIDWSGTLREFIIIFAISAVLLVCLKYYELKTAPKKGIQKMAGSPAAKPAAKERTAVRIDHPHYISSDESECSLCGERFEKKTSICPCCGARFTEVETDEDEWDEEFDEEDDWDEEFDDD